MPFSMRDPRIHANPVAGNIETIAIVIQGVAPAEQKSYWWNMISNDSPGGYQRVATHEIIPLIMLGLQTTEGILEKPFGGTVQGRIASGLIRNHRHAGGAMCYKSYRTTAIHDPNRSMMDWC